MFGSLSQVHLKLIKIIINLLAAIGIFLYRLPELISTAFMCVGINMLDWGRRLYIKILHLCILYTITGI